MSKPICHGTTVMKRIVYHYILLYLCHLPKNEKVYTYLSHVSPINNEEIKLSVKGLRFHPRYIIGYLISVSHLTSIPWFYHIAAFNLYNYIFISVFDFQRMDWENWTGNLSNRKKPLVTTHLSLSTKVKEQRNKIPSIL